MSSGAPLFGRYRLLRSLPPLGELLRWEAEDLEEGRRVELISPESLTLLRPGARERFAATHRPMPDGPYVLGRMLGEHEGRPYALRPALHPLPATLRLDPADVERLLAAWAPAVARDAALLGPDLDEQDVGVDDDGHLRLAPSGVVRREGAVRTSPWLPPEAQPRPEKAALYGLGRLAFRWLTGVEPADVSSPDALRASQSRPRRAGALVPGTPPALDAALAALLSPDPGARRPPFDEAPAQILVGAPVEEAAPAPLAAQARPPSARLDAALPDQALIAWPHQLPRSIRRRLAALSGHSSAALEALAAQKLPLPLATGPSSATLDPAPFALAAAPLAQRPTAGSSGPYLLAVAGTLVSLLSMGAALILGLLPLAIGALVAGLAMVGGALLRLLLREAPLGKALRAAQDLLARAATAPQPELAARIQTLRRRLLDPQLPDAIRVDLLDSLDAVEDAAEALPANASRPQRAPVEAALQALETPLRAAGPRLDVEALRQRVAAATQALRS
jgi:hypothetical protein